MKRILTLCVATALVVFFGACSDGNGGGGGSEYTREPGVTYKTMGDFLQVKWMSGPGAQAWQSRSVTDFIGKTHNTDNTIAPVYAVGGTGVTSSWIEVKDEATNTVRVAWRQTGRTASWQGLVISGQALGGFELGDQIRVIGRVINTGGAFPGEGGASNRAVLVNGDLDDLSVVGGNDAQGFVRADGEVPFDFTAVIGSANLGNSQVRIQSNHWGANDVFPRDGNGGITTIIIEQIVLARAGDNTDPVDPPADPTDPTDPVVRTFDSFLNVSWMTGAGRPTWADIPLSDLIDTTHIPAQVPAVYSAGGTAGWIVDPDDGNLMAWRQTNRNGNWNGLVISGEALGGFQVGDTISVVGRAVTEGTLEGEDPGRSIFINNNLFGQAVMGGNNAQGFVTAPSTAAGTTFTFTVTVRAEDIPETIRTSNEDATLTEPVVDGKFPIRIQSQIWNNNNSEIPANNGVPTIIIRSITITRP